MAGKKLNKTDREYISKNFELSSPEDISAHINKPIELIQEYIDTVSNKDRKSLRNSKAWKQLKDEFDVDELEYFEEQYTKYIEQFREDVLVTEETQIFLVIKFEIMMHRNAKAKRNASKDIARLSKLQSDFLARFTSPSEMSDEDRTFLLNVETQIQAAKASEQARSTEYIKLEEKHQALLKDLKATRDQRVTRIESSKETYLAIIKKLAEAEEREITGREMELMKMATDREYKRLTALHTFEDGSQDSPVLIPEEQKNG
mgnify:CR=1 FL=1